MYQHSQLAGGNGSGTAALSLDSAILPRPTRTRRDGVSLVVDLGADIGSRDWWRGLATLVALGWAAWSLAPGLAPINGSIEAPLPDAQWDEARTLAISPLAYGADTGRRMAATDAVQPLAETPERPRIDLTATMGEGDGLAHVLERSGVSDAEAAQVETMVAGVLPVADIAAGTGFNVTLGRRPNKSVPRPLEALSFRARFDLKLAVAREGGALRLNRIPIAVDDTPLRIQGSIGGSLYRAARAAGASARAVEAYIRAIATQLPVESLGASDRFDLILEHRRAATGETETGQLLYAGLSRPGRKDLQLMQWTANGDTQWFEASGVGKARGMFQRPVPGVVTSNFGMRFHPILGFTRMHKGVDFRAGYGTPILAAADGTVARAGWAGGYGNQVRLSHTSELATSYSHMARILVSPGAHVKQGQVIGYVGATGLATGPHLHYELYRNGAQINPNSVQFLLRPQLAGDDLSRFRSQLSHLLAVKPGAANAAKAQVAAQPNSTHQG